MAQQRQHAVIQMGIMLNLLNKYHQAPKPESGTEIPYDVQQLRKMPQRLTQWLEERQNQTRPTKPLEQRIQLKETDIWQNLHSAFQQGLLTTYTTKAETKQNSYLINPKNIKTGEQTLKRSK